MESRPKLFVNNKPRYVSANTSIGNLRLRYRGCSVEQIDSSGEVIAELFNSDDLLLSGNIYNLCLPNILAPVQSKLN